MPKIQIDPDRFDDLLGDEFFGFFEGNPIWLYRALSHFAILSNDELKVKLEYLRKQNEKNPDDKEIEKQLKYYSNGFDGYLLQNEAFIWLKANFTLRQIKEVRSEFLKNLQDRAAPLEREKPSETVPSQEQK